MLSKALVTQWVAHISQKLRAGRPVLRIRDVYPGSDFFPSRIPEPNFLHPGSRIRNKELKYFTPKYCFKAFRNMIRVVHPGSGSRFLPIPDPGSGSASLWSTLQRSGQHTLERKKYTKHIITRNQKPTIVVGSQAKSRHEEDEPRCPLPSRHLCHVCAPSVSGPPFSSCHAIVAPFPPSVVTNPKLSSSAPLLQYDTLHQRKHFLISCCLLEVLLYFSLFCCICRVAWRSYGAVLWDSSLSLLQTDQAPSISRLSPPLYH